MRLNLLEGGDGDRVVVLLHGLAGSAESWWRVHDLLASQGCRVLALDLPGHGLSDRDPQGSVERAAASVVETVASAIDGHPWAALGHSYGGLILGAAAPGLGAGTVVHVDTPLRIAGQGSSELVERYRRQREDRTADQMRRTRPHYGERDVEVEARAARRFDPVTAAAVLGGPDIRWSPAAGSIVVRSDSSGHISDQDCQLLSSRGVQVRTVTGAAHSIWYSHFHECVTALPEVFHDTWTH